MNRLDLADFFLIAEAVTATPTDDLRTTTNIALAESALAMPFAGVVDREFFPEAHEKIAVLGYRLAAYHALRDGNKRTAWTAMRMMASINGLELQRPDGGEDEIVDVMTSVAAGTLSEHALVEWVRGLLRPE